MLHNGPVQHDGATDVADSIDLQRFWLARSFCNPAAWRVYGWVITGNARALFSNGVGRSTETEKYSMARPAIRHLATIGHLAMLLAFVLLTLVPAGAGRYRLQLNTALRKAAHADTGDVVACRHGLSSIANCYAQLR